MDIANRVPTRLAIDLLDPQPGERILDAGCGTGAAIAGLLDRAECRVAGIDPSPAMISSARRRLGWRALLQQCTIEETPAAMNGFDAALALNLFYFADRQGAMIDALRRALKPGGRLVAYVTDRAAMERWPFAQQGVHRLFDEGELVRALEAGGFDPARISVHSVSITRSINGLFARAIA